MQNTTLLRTSFPAGAIAGLLFYSHALFPQAYFYPFVWPLMAGALTVYVTRSSHILHRWRDTLRLGGGVGIVAGIFFLIPGVGTLYSLSRVRLPNVVCLPNGSTPRPLITFLPSNQSVDHAMLINAVLVVLVGIVPSAMVGAALARWLLFRRVGLSGPSYAANQSTEVAGH